MQTLMIYKLGFNQNYYTFTFLLLTKIVLCGEFPCTKFLNYKCFGVRSSNNVTMIVSACLHIERRELSRFDKQVKGDQQRL